MTSSSPRTRMTRFVQVAIALLVAGSAAIAIAQSTPASAPTAAPALAPVNDEALKKTLETRLGTKIDAITRTPLANLYEVRVNEDIFYADPSGNYIVVGNVIDVRSRENLTRKRAEAIREASIPKFKFAELPLDAAVKIVRGSGKRQVAIFEDPNCGYCKKLEKSIQDLGDVTIYVFLYPVLGPDSLAKSKQIWCAPNRAKAWNEWMQAGTNPGGEGACDNPIDKTLALGKKYRVEGTPTLFFGNDKRVEGAIEKSELEKLLAG